MYAVAVGNMFDGTTFYGPFDEFEDAEIWAGDIVHTSWWIIKLYGVEED